MAKDVTPEQAPLRRHLAYTHSAFSAWEESVLHQHHLASPIPQSQNPQLEEHIQRQRRQDPHSDVTSLEAEDEIDLSPVYDKQQSLHGPLVARTYHCSQCFKSTDSPREHLHHLVQEHRLDLTIYECDVCDYATKYKQKLAHHRSSHQSSGTPPGIGPSVFQKACLPKLLHTESDMLGTSGIDDRYGYTQNSHKVGVDDKGNPTMDVQFMRMKDFNENVKQHYVARKINETDLMCNEKIEASRISHINNEEQNLLCNESVVSDPAEFELKSLHKKGIARADDDGDHLVIDLGDNQSAKHNNNNLDFTPAILKAVSLATPNSIAARPTMMPVTLSMKRDVMDIRPTPTPVVTTPNTTKLTKKGTVPVREAVDPAKYVRLQDVDGVRYACSKCGNVYKWRKSLNKHWKEKHDGEIPVPASGSFTNILNVPNFKGTPQYVTPKTSTTSSRSIMSPSMLNSSGTISSYALDKYIVDMGAQSGGRSIQSHPYTTNTSPAAAAAAAAVLATRNMLMPGGFNAMMHPTNIPFTNAQQVVKQPTALNSIHYTKPEITVTTPTLPKLPNFLANYSQNKMRLPTQLPPPAAHGRSLLKHEVQDDDSCDDMPLDLSKKSIPTTSILNLTSGSPSISGSNAGTSMMGDQPLDFSVKSNPCSERSTPVHHGRSSRGNLDYEEPIDHQPWIRTTSTPESDIYSNLQCYKCPFVGSDKASFEEHLDQHANYSQYPQCAQCKQHFSSNDELTQHFGLHHLHILKQINMAEDDCKESHIKSSSGKETEGQLYLYLTNPHDSQEQKCVVCNAKFPRHNDLCRHFTHLHPDLPNPYSKKRSLENDCTDNEPWHKVSKFELYGSNEGKQGSIEGELECEQCSFVARDVSEMARHQLVHSFNRPHACTMCGFSSKSRDELQSHMWKYHPAHAEELALLTSGGATTPVSFARSRSEPGSNNAESPTHNAADTSGSSAHSGEFGFDDVIIVTPNTTEVPLVRGRKIGKSGSSSSAEILLPYKCSVCEYRARWPSEITQHMKNHSDEKPYHCPRCTYKSKWKWDVVKHLKRCGGGTVKDVIDTSRHYRKSETEDGSSPLSNQSVVKQLQFRNTSPKPTMLSNGPPNVTVLPTGSPTHMGLHEPLGSYSPTNLHQEPLDYAGNASPTHSFSPASMNDTYDGKAQAINSILNQGLYQCLKCPFVANSPAELKRHCRVHSDEKPFTCQTCGYSSKWKCDLKKHVRTYNHRATPRSYNALHETKDGNGKVLSGDDDYDNMSSSDEMSVDLTHADPHSVSPAESPTPKPPLYKCDKCQYVTYKKNFLDGHMKIHRTTHEKSGKLKCKQCDFNALDLPSFLQHKLTHSTQQMLDPIPIMKPTIVPDLTQINIESRIDIDTSPQRHRRKPIKYLTCCKCPYTSLQQAKLDNHESLHELHRPNSLSCEFCDYNVSNQSLLIQHMKLHPNFDSWYDIHGHTLDDDLLEVTESQDMDEAELEESVKGFSKSRGEAMNLCSKNESGGMKLILANPTESGQGFRCSKCTFYCENRILFENHIRQHGSYKQFQCEHCDWSAGRLNQLYKHVREVHPQHLTLRESSDGNNTSREGTPVAEEKPTRFESVSGRRKVPRKADTCADCGYISDNYGKMANHKLKHESEIIKKCHYCGENIITRYKMQEHLWTIHDVHVGSPEEVDKASKAFPEITRKRTRSQQSSTDDCSSKQLIDVKGQQVYVIHNGNRKVFACPMCSYRTNNCSHCVSHVLHHGSGKKYTCEYCDYSLEQLSHIFHHMKMCHSNEIDTTDTETDTPTTPSKKGSNNTSYGPKLVCSYCPYWTRSRDKLQRHVEKHDYNGQFTCNQCHFSVDKENLLQEHLPVHVRNRQWKRRYLSLSGSKAQRKTNVVYKPVLQKPSKPTPASKERMKTRYRCTKCPYSTACKNNLMKHQQLHLMQGKYKCPQCDYCVTRYILLKQHLNLHTNGEVNGKGYDEFSANETNKHITKSGKVFNYHHGLHSTMKKFSCDYCNFTGSIKHVKQHRHLHDDQVGFNSNPDPKMLLSKLPIKRPRSTIPKLRIVLKPTTNKVATISDGPSMLYKCTECPFACNKRQRYESHSSFHGASGLHQCAHCSYTVPHLNLLQRHLRLHKFSSKKHRLDKDRFRCSKCPYHTHSKSILDIHFKMHLRQPLVLVGHEMDNSKCSYRCDYCSYQSVNKNNFENHRRQHEVTSKMEGSFCDYSSLHTAALDSQIRRNFPDTQLDRPALRTLISRTNISAVITPETSLHLDDVNSGMTSINEYRKGYLELSNNNNKDVHAGTICQYCECGFANEAEKAQHEKQHLIGAS